MGEKHTANVELRGAPMIPKASNAAKLDKKQKPKKLTD